jgi:serine/threonine protein kinase
MDDRRSERFGRYEILGELGRGAMGIVYKARDPKINRIVAVKTVSLKGQPVEEESAYRDRFFREAEAAGRLSHPGIVTIFDVGEEPDTRAPYIVMEFVKGNSLDKFLTKDDEKLPLETAVQIALEVADALDCAHGQGVVHRDLKPANILITEDGRAKIADFGIAKLNLASQTMAGVVLGTPAFMSPEQLNGDAVDGRSDLFSLGVILYTLLTGYRPFQGNSAMTVSFKVVNREPVRASVLDPNLPSGLDYVISRAMAKDPSERYQRGMEMVLDIQEIRAGREPWSKTKQPLPADATQAGSVIRERKGERQSAGTEFGHVDRLQLFGRGTLATVRRVAAKNPMLSAVVIVLGLILLPFGLSYSFWPQRQLPADSPKLAVVKPAPGAPGAAASAVENPGPAHAIAANPAMPKAASSNASVAKNPPSRLDVEVEHNFASARLSIWVDGSPVYTRRLEGEDKKHLVVFHGVKGHESHVMQVPSGKHQIRVRIISDQQPYEQSQTVEGDFDAGNERMLRIRFNKRGEMNLSLQ